jgi:hypothetical protein
MPHNDHYLHVPRARTIGGKQYHGYEQACCEINWEQRRRATLIESFEVVFDHEERGLSALDDCFWKESMYTDLSSCMIRYVSMI